MPYRDPEKRKAATKAYYEANKDKCKERSKAYHNANKDKLRETGRAWNNANKDKKRAYRKKWQDNNKEKMKLLRKVAHEYKKYGVSPSFREDMLKRQKSKCGNPTCPTRIDFKNSCIHHNHTTNSVECLLCYRCNMAEGHLSKCHPEAISGLVELIKREALFHGIAY